MTSSAPLQVKLMFVSSKPELVVGISFQAFFLVLPASPLIDFFAFCLGLADVGVRYRLPRVCMLLFYVLFEWSTIRLYGAYSQITSIFSNVISET
jgi:hypothetical protein